MVEQSKRVLGWTVFGLAILILLTFSMISGAYTALQWFISQGYGDVWWKTRIAQVQFYFVGLSVSVLLYALNYWFGSARIRANFGGSRLSSQLRVLYLGAPLLPAVFVHGPSFAALWDEYVLFRHGGQFGLVDPILGVDASFYMFALDFYTALLNWFRVLFVFTALYSVALYLVPLQGVDLASNKRRFQEVLNLGVSQLSLSVALFILATAATSYFGRYALLYDGGSDKLAGAAYADVHARMGAYVVFAVLGVVLALTTAAAGFTRRWKAPAVAAGVWVVVYVVLLRIYPWAVQTISVSPNELSAETPFIEHSIKFTRVGYALDAVDKQPFDAHEVVNAAALNRNPTIVKNIRLWDYRPVRSTYKQLQEIKPYYEFADVDIDRYRVNGEIRQVLISARELNHNELPSRARSWIQSHLQYTHGYGVVVSPTNRVTPAGLPELWVKDFPPQIVDGMPKIKRPGIYYGELTNEYAVVGTATKEIDYPRDQDFAPTQYNGKGGVRLGTGLRRLLLAWQFDTWKLLVSDEVKPDSRILFNRQIHQAVRSIAPFLVFDQDPYIVIGDDGNQYWIMDAYTTSDRFPYSQRFDREVFSRVSGSGKQSNFTQFAGINYIRSSVKVVIDAYDGTIKFYRFDPKDPVLRAWSSFFPGIFQPMSAMPAFLKAHLRYPEMMFLLQAGIYSDYHMDHPQAFYNREDRWQIATEQYSGRTRKVEPYYTVIKLPGQTEPEYILMLPFVPKSKQNLIAWMAARCDFVPGEGREERYGQLVVLDFPRARQFYGPIQIESRIDQDADISRDLTLWNQEGSQVIRGNLLVIPIENSLLYVEPVYLQSTQSPFPELKRVVVADSNSVVMRETLAEALSALTSGSVRVAGNVSTSGAGSQGRDEALREIARGARNALNRARRAAGEGKWKDYGREMETLEGLLNRMSRSE